MLGGLGSDLDVGKVEGSLGGLEDPFYLGHIIMEGFRLGLGIWVGFTLFWAVAAMRSLVRCDARRFRVAFGVGGS